MESELLKKFRYFLKDSVRLAVDFSQTAQNRGVPPPPVEKPFDPDSQLIDLVAPDQLRKIKNADVISAIGERRSHRAFRNEALSMQELSLLLWATQGVRKALSPGTVFRTVPSAGCRHAFESYLSVLHVSGLAPGLYRYLPLEHQLLFVSEVEDLSEKMVAATLGQSFVGKAPVTFIWTALPSRMEWRYGIAAHKVIAIDAGHVCQNLYLACAATGLGTCAVAAYHQELIDQLLQVDGEEEFTIYLAPVGKV